MEAQVMLNIYVNKIWLYVRDLHAWSDAGTSDDDPCTREEHAARQIFCFFYKSLHVC